MHQNPSPVAIVIVSYNTVGLLRRCLASLAVCALPLRVVVVDNCSADGSPEMVRAAFPEAELIALDENAGFARGTNIGLAALGFQEAGGRRQEAGNPASCLLPPASYFLILNPDTEVRPGAIEALVAFLEAHPRVGVASPRLLNPDGTPQAAAFRFPSPLMTALDLFPPGEVLPGRLYGSWWHGRYPQERGDAPFAIDHPLGACMLLRPEVIAQVGGLDTGYFMYSEEIEWCWRIRAAGWAIWQVPQAQVVHVGGASTRQLRWRMLVALYRSRARFADSHYAPAARLAHRGVVRIGMLRLALRAWRSYAQKQISHDELRAHLLAYGEITRL
ncbi:glycosyltransferase family 2 protein [Oscillochloris sp. ZM17-4]|uniref:glycosyltransferase family 2 protein n=1 Tax=Oscillochloris sp. ZM17-4 TaxID=2866714 RepID=UPI002107342B|nr:glycosyltransferase family 2 protein [Oscillochloris sp. ZM17-4]